MKSLTEKLIIFALLLSSCGTLTGRKEIISVDSDVRGETVFQDDRPIGRTPFFTEQTRSSEVSLKVKRNEQVKDLNYDCHIRWGPSIAGNGVLGGWAALSGS